MVQTGEFFCFFGKIQGGAAPWAHVSPGAAGWGQSAPAPETAKPSSDKYVEYKDLVINLSNYEVLYKGKPVEMTPREIELLFFLASSPNQVFTREQLLDHIWGYEYAGDTRTVDVHIKRIREKIADTDEWSIGTVWSVGYRFEVHNKK